MVGLAVRKGFFILSLWLALLPSSIPDLPRLDRVVGIANRFLVPIWDIPLEHLASRLTVLWEKLNPNCLPINARPDKRGSRCAVEWKAPPAIWKSRERARCLAEDRVYVDVSAWKNGGWLDRFYTPARCEYRGKVATRWDELQARGEIPRRQSGEGRHPGSEVTDLHPSIYQDARSWPGLDSYLVLSGFVPRLGD